MATICRHFTEFCPPRGTDAWAFFKQLVRGGTRQGCRLQRLSLMKDTYNPHASRRQREVTALLALAGMAAKTLPQLRILELWSPGPPFRYIFRYTQDDFRAIITWRVDGSDIDLEPSAVEWWTKAASTRILTVEVVPFPEPEGQFAVLSHLSLRRLAMDAITEERIRAGQMG